MRTRETPAAVCFFYERRHTAAPDQPPPSLRCLQSRPLDHPTGRCISVQTQTGLVWICPGDEALTFATRDRRGRPLTTTGARSRLETHLVQRGGGARGRTRCFSKRLSALSFLTRPAAKPRPLPLSPGDWWNLITGLWFQLPSVLQSIIR